MTREIIFTEKAPKAVGSYVQGMKSKGMVYCSGQLGINPEEGKLVEGVFPARSCIQVAKLPLDGLVEIECIAEGE